jgi:hypothetical protein
LYATEVKQSEKFGCNTIKSLTFPEYICSRTSGERAALFPQVFISTAMELNLWRMLGGGIVGEDGGMNGASTVLCTNFLLLMLQRYKTGIPFKEGE